MVAAFTLSIHHLRSLSCDEQVVECSALAFMGMLRCICRLCQLLALPVYMTYASEEGIFGLVLSLGSVAPRLFVPSQTIKGATILEDRERGGG